MPFSGPLVFFRPYIQLPYSERVVPLSTRPSTRSTPTPTKCTCRGGTSPKEESTSSPSGTARRTPPSSATSSVASPRSVCSIASDSARSSTVGKVGVCRCVCAKNTVQLDFIKNGKMFRVVRFGLTSSCRCRVVVGWLQKSVETEKTREECYDFQACFWWVRNLLQFIFFAAFGLDNFWPVFDYKPWVWKLCTITGRMNCALSLAGCKIN